MGSHQHLTVHHRFLPRAPQDISIKAVRSSTELLCCQSPAAARPGLFWDLASLAESNTRGVGLQIPVLTSTCQHSPSHIPPPLYPKAEFIFVCILVTSSTLSLSNPTCTSSLFVSEQSGTDAGVLSNTARVFPQAGEAGGRDGPRLPRQGLRAWAQADFAVQWTRPQSVSAWERPTKESQRLAGAPSSPKRGLAVAGRNCTFCTGK